MSSHKLHLHSMMVHSIAALAPLSAITFIFLIQQVQIFTLDEKTWSFFTVFSLSMILLITLPSILSGVFERGHVYAKWHNTHKLKMGISSLFMTFLTIEIIYIIQNGVQSEMFSLLGILIIFGNNILVFLLCTFGLKITLGRQSLAKTSYTADLFKKDHIDILVTAGEQKKVEPKYIDLTQER